MLHVVWIYFILEEVKKEREMKYHISCHNCVMPCFPSSCLARCMNLLQHLEFSLDLFIYSIHNVKRNPFFHLDNMTKIIMIIITVVLYSSLFFYQRISFDRDVVRTDVTVSWNSRYVQNSKTEENFFFFSLSFSAFVVWIERFLTQYPY